jgi:iron(III) transport system substrate-binding protein
MRNTRFATGLGALALMLAQILAQPGGAQSFTIDKDTWFGLPQARQTLEIIATADTDLFAPVINAYIAQNPDLRIRYSEAPSIDTHIAITEAGAQYDVVISSAMDLQIKLANDGFAAPITPAGADSLPDWARWRDLVFSVAQEPAVLIVHDSVLRAGHAIPRSRHDLIDLLRENPQMFDGRIGTYDPVTSGVGYMFATQDARATDSFWRLSEVLGRLNARLFCCSFDMLEAVREGELLMAYNVIGSYAATHLDADDPVHLIELEDYTLTLLRTALVPISARAPQQGVDFLSFMLSEQGRRLIAEAARLPPVDVLEFLNAPHLRPIQLDPGLLTGLDQQIRQQFLNEWTAAMEQP